MKKITKLTKKQKDQIPTHVQKWIDIGLRTGEADWDTFDKYMPLAYEAAGLTYPKRVVRVDSPIVGALAASISNSIFTSGNNAVGNAVDSTVGGAVDSAARYHVTSKGHAVVVYREKGVVIKPVE